MQNRKKNKIRVVELFAGVGGFRLGFEKASPLFETIWANQWEPGRKSQYAYECYKQRFGIKNNCVNEDIALVKSQVPDHDLLVGGFPCQDYSVARTGAQGIQGKKGALWWDIRDIVEAKRPKYILLENCIPVERNGKWGLIDINGNELTPVQYDGFGCDADTSDSRYADVLIIPELNGIVVELDEVNGNTRTKKYGVVTSDGNLFINIVLDSIYAVTTQGETTYYATFQGQILDLVDFVRQQQASYEQNNSGSSNETSNTVNTTNTANVSQNNSEN